MRLEHGPAHGSGERLHGRVQLELRGALRVRALEVCARGLAAVHWLESRSIGLNVVYRDYTAFQTFLYRHRQLIPGKAAAQGGGVCARAWGWDTLGWVCVLEPWALNPLGWVCEPACGV